MDTILTAILAAILTIAIYYAYILHERITVLTEEIDDAEKQLAVAAAGADRLGWRVDQFVKTLALMVAEMERLERENDLLKKRSGRNSQVMRHNVMPHYRGH